MAIVAFQELIDILIMTVAIGFIFKDIFAPKQTITADYDPLKHHRGPTGWQKFKFAAAVTAPAIIFHEMGHKLVSMIYGLQGTFHAAYTWLGIGLVLKLVGSPFLFVVPAYVSICEIPGTGMASRECLQILAQRPLIGAAIAFAGPFVNLLMWLGAWYMLKFHSKKLSNSWKLGLHYSKFINLFLFFFNMIPLGMFDGAKVFSGLWQGLF